MFLLARYERKRLIIAAFVAGYAAPIPAMIVIYLLAPNGAPIDLADRLLRSYLLAGGIEEAAKLAILLLILRRAGERTSMKEIVSVAAATAAGFATFENLLYAGSPMATLIVRSSARLNAS